MSVRIGIDIGENVIKFHRLQQSNDQEINTTLIVREPHYDMIGYGMIGNYDMI